MDPNKTNHNNNTGIYIFSAILVKEMTLITHVYIKIMLLVGRVCGRPQH